MGSDLAEPLDRRPSTLRLSAVNHRAPGGVGPMPSAAPKHFSLSLLISVSIFTFATSFAYFGTVRRDHSSFSSPASWAAAVME